MDQQARNAGVVIVPLKEAALLRLGLYPGGARPVANVDLLVPECDGARMQQLLHALGYLDTSVSWRHRVFERAERAFSLVRNVAASFGVHPDRPIRIDLHTRIAERLPLIAADVSELIFPPAPHPGLNRYPSSMAMFVHLLLQAAGSMSLRTLRLIQLHDLALLAARMCELDWQRLLACRIDNRALWWTVPPLELLVRYYPQAIPTAVLAALRRCCPRAVRGVPGRQTISEVCLASLRNEARDARGCQNAVSVGGA
jgi:hypothetical protein